MSTIITVPAEIVSQVRIGLPNVLADGAEEITAAVEREGYERSPKWFQGGRAKLERACALLDLIGWSEPERAAAVRVDLREHGKALNEALRVMLMVGEDDLEEADPVDAARARRGEPPKREATTKRVLALREFAASLGAIDEEARQ
jgi:hypothetical protein